MRATQQLQGARSVVEMHRYFAKVLENRRAEPQDDIISDLANATLDDGRLLNMSEALSILQQLLVAGNETTTNALAGGLAYILETPGLADRLAADPSLIPNVVEEILRLEAPTKHMWRIVKHDTELGGVALPAKRETARKTAWTISAAGRWAWLRTSLCKRWRPNSSPLERCGHSVMPSV